MAWRVDDINLHALVIDGDVLGEDGNAAFAFQLIRIQNALAAELRGAYPLENLLPIDEAGQLDLIEADVEIIPGLRSRVTGGHTRGHQALVFTSSGQTAVYPGDLCPMTAHVRQMWTMAFDTHPLETRRNKPQLLGEAADGGWWILWDHDPDVAVSRLARDEQQEFVAVQSRETL